MSDGVEALRNALCKVGEKLFSAIPKDEVQEYKGDPRLDACPFCGGFADFCRSSRSEYSVYIETVYAQCHQCVSTSAQVDVSAEYCANDRVIELWNRRAISDEEDE